MGRCKPLLLLSRFCRVRLCDPVNSSPLGSCGILQARILEWAAMSFSIPGFYMHLSYLGPVSPVSSFTLLLALFHLHSNHHEERQHPLDCSFGSPHSHLGARYFHFTVYPHGHKFDLGDIS